LNTTSLLKHCSSYLKISSTDTMHYAEKLYLSGYITYPRTESTSYPVNFSHIDIIKCLDKS